VLRAHIPSSIAAALAAALGVALLLWTGCRGGPGARDSAALPELPPKRQAIRAQPGEALPARWLRLAMVGEVRGELEPCGCPTTPFGGFHRRQNYLDQLRGAPIGGPLFHFDVGEALLKGQATRSRSDAAARAATLVALMEQVGVDVFAPGPSDLLALGEGALPALRAAPFPALSANWRDPESGEALLPGRAVVERDGLKVGVIGLSRRPSDPAWRTHVRWTDPVEAARAEVAALPEGLDLVVALSNLERVDALRVAAEVQGLAALLSTRGDKHEPLLSTAGSPVVETPDRGRFVTVLTLRMASRAGSPLQLEDRAVSGQLKRTLEIAARLRTLGAMEGADPALIAKLEAEGEALAAELSAAGAGRNIGRRSERPLGTDLDDDVGGPGSVDDTLATFRGDQLARAKAIVAEASARADEREPAYVSMGGCGGCHNGQVARWVYTGHKDALETLRSRDQHKNPECVGCHTTGFARPGGFAEVNGRDLETFKGVQCEACHGPLSLHPGRHRELPSVTEAVCLECHDEANSPDFDYATYITRVTCPGSSL